MRSVYVAYPSLDDPSTQLKPLPIAPNVGPHATHVGNAARAERSMRDSGSWSRVEEVPQSATLIALHVGEHDPPEVRDVDKRVDRRRQYWEDPLHASVVKERLFSANKKLVEGETHGRRDRGVMNRDFEHVRGDFGDARAQPRSSRLDQLENYFDGPR